MQGRSFCFSKKAKTSKNAVFASGAEGGSRTRMKLPSADFESAASAIPPLRHLVNDINIP